MTAVDRSAADAVEIETLAKRNLADENDAAQDRGEISIAGNSSTRKELNSAAGIGSSHKDGHDARFIRQVKLHQSHYLSLTNS